MTVPRFETIQDLQFYLDGLEVPSWQRVTMTPLGSSWVNHGAGWGVPEYWACTDGTVELYGLVASGIAGTIYTMPPNLSPPENQMFITMTNTGPVRIDVLSSGAVVINGGGGNVYMSLAGIRWHRA